MSKNYFSQMSNESKSRFWINNPNMMEMEKAIKQGAANCTTNPAYCSKLLASDNEYIIEVIDDVINNCLNIETAATEVVKIVTKRLMNRLLPLYEKTNGMSGFVTIQDDPRNDSDFDATLKAIFDNKKSGKNYMAKIPVIAGGIESIEACVEYNIPICATEVFSIAQAIMICDKYESAVKKYGNKPPFYVTHISGIFDEYLKKNASRNCINIAPEVINMAGLTVARKQYRIMKDRGYNAVLLGGGARSTEHLTGIMGGEAHVTVNWSTVEEILNSDIEFTDQLSTPEDPKIVNELIEKLPDFKKAFDENGLTYDEFSDYGPVQLFRNSFLNGWYQLLATIAKHKTVHAI